MIDKVTDDRFLRWNALSANGIDAAFGAGAPAVRIGGAGPVGLLRPSDTQQQRQAEPARHRGQPKCGADLGHPGKSAGAVPRREPVAAAKLATSQSAAGEHPVGADIEIRRGRASGREHQFLRQLHKPELHGSTLPRSRAKSARFGTRIDQARRSAIARTGQFQRSDGYYGSLNPLAPQAFVDIKAKADGIDLPNLTPYSTKYTGYPITKGTLDHRRSLPAWSMAS